MEEVPLELGLEGSVGVQRAVSGAKKSEVGVRRSEQNSCGERDVWGAAGTVAGGAQKQGNGTRTGG